MSRVAKMPVPLPAGVEVSVAGQRLTIKGAKGTLEYDVHPVVEVSLDAKVLSFAARTPAASADALAGTTRAVVNGLVTGVSKGFERKLNLVGVGYRAQAAGRTLNLTLGYSHPISFAVPEGVTIETPTQTEIVVKGADKQQVGQVAAVIRRFRPPEPYKGKGVRYSDEVVVRKEAKKK
jgi:large subunit ribosomal protein L6